MGNSSKKKRKPVKGKLRRKFDRLMKKAWDSHRRSAKARRAKRKEFRKGQRTASRSFRDEYRAKQRSDAFSPAIDYAPRTKSFWARNWVLADFKDAVAQRGHELLDRRDLRSGILTNDELDAFDQFDGPEEWRAEMLRRRKENYNRQRARNRDIDTGPLVMAYGGGQKAGVPQVKHAGFRPPIARASTLKPTPAPTWQSPNRRTRRVKRKDRVEKIVKQWGPELRTNARNAMAADGDLSSALQALYNFAEQFPETRTQIHESLGKMAEFGKGYSEAMDTYEQTLRTGVSEENPGLPPEVLQHLKPLQEVGAEIERASQAVIAAWEDYFQDAIKVAQDEHTPSKQALIN